MTEALEIMHRLLDGEKVDFDGEYYTADKAKLYSLPVSSVPIWMAAGGPKSAAFAGAHADGLITSVKNPADTLERIIGPFREASEGRSDAPPTIMATRWCVLAADEDEAWEALASMRGLRAPDRLRAVDPMTLRVRADNLDRQEVLGKYTLVDGTEALIETYKPLVRDIGADYVSVQVASTQPERTIEILGKEVLPELRSLS